MQYHIGNLRSLSLGQNRQPSDPHQGSMPSTAPGPEQEKCSLLTSPFIEPPHAYSQTRDLDEQFNATQMLGWSLCQQTLPICHDDVVVLPRQHSVALPNCAKATSCCLHLPRIAPDEKGLLPPEALNDKYSRQESRLLHSHHCHS